MAIFYTSVERYGNSILYVGRNGRERIVERIRYKPTLFVPTNKDSEYSTLTGLAVAPIKPGSMTDCKEFIETHTASNFSIHGNTDYVSQFITEMFPAGCEFDINAVNVTFTDIEVQSDEGFPKPEEAKWPVTAITLVNNQDRVFYVWSTVVYDITKTIIPDRKVVYVRCKDEAELLKKFLFHWALNHPDIISGWNSEFFDITYLINRCAKVLGDDMLTHFSIHGIAPRRREDKFSGEYYEISGMTQLDYLKLFKKFAGPAGYGNQESYRLDFIANVVLKEKKLDYSEYSSLTELYLKNPQKFIDYNIKDTSLVERMDAKENLILLAMTLAYKANVNYNTVYGSTKIWDTFIYKVLLSKNIIISPAPYRAAGGSIEGAFIKEPHKGMHDWVCSFDLNSLYPHLIMQYNMSPETIVDERIPGVSVSNLLAKKKFDIPANRCMTATGQLFRTDIKGVFPQIIDKLYNERANIKAEMLVMEQIVEDGKQADIGAIENKISKYHNEQHAIKILLNSLYGSMANEHFRYFDNRMAEAITVSGQVSIQWAEDVVNKYMNKILDTVDVDYVLAIDTDSLYVKLGELVKKVMPVETDQLKICRFIDKVSSERFEPIILAAYEELRNYVHAPEQRMFMKRELIANRVLFTGKKKYIASILNKEGVQYAKPKIKVTGIESVRSSTPAYCRKLIEETIELIMTRDESSVQDFIRGSRAAFLELDVEDVAFPRGVSDIGKYYDRHGRTYTKGVPIHVRAAIIYNNMVEEKNLSNKYEMIYDGNKIKFAYMKLPNPTREDVIGFPTVFPPEFDLKKFVDFDKQFDKAYIAPVKNILDAIGWETHKRNTIEGFFS